MPSHTHFSGPRLKRAMLAAGLRNEHLGVAVERTANCIRGYTDGTINPPAHIVCQLADLLGIPVADLFDQDDTIIERKAA